MPAPPSSQPGTPSVDDSRRTTHEPGRTSPEQMKQPVPRLPHERDESADSQGTQPPPEIQQAYDDVVRGKRDTGKLPVTDQTYNDKVVPPGSRRSGTGSGS